MEKIEKIILIGAGNVATQLGEALQRAGISILQVYSRTPQSAKELSSKLGCNYTHVPGEIQPGADLYLFSVSDNALAEVLNRFPHKSALVAHTSGSIPLAVLQQKGFAGGVFYPLQTFSKSIKPDFHQIPFCIEATDESYAKRLKQLADKLSHDVRMINSEQRRAIHIAAVFACNFTNHMFAIADELLEQKGITFDILQPLIEETFNKAKNRKPAQVQTGPAVRNDQQIIQKHLDELDSLPDYQNIYNFISQSIIRKNKSGN